MRQGHIFRSVLLATSALVPLGLVPAYSNPQGGQVVGGSASISTQGSTTTITQTTERAAINWNTFNINAGETTKFVQPNAGSIALNRVTGGQGPSSINGTITANGQVWIINPAGILIGSGAVVNTAGFLATTNDIKNNDFMDGRYNFTIPGRPDASVVNLGTITATNGGFAALVAPGVRNSGTITATFGKVALASANTFSLDFYGDGLITLGVNDSIAGQVKDVATGETLKSLVTNDGVLSANGGRVELSAVSARQIVNSVINTSGVIEARSIGNRNGMIVLSGQTSKTKVAGSAKQTVKVSGTLDVSGTDKGGTVKVTGENIELASATIKAFGGTGGGTVMIGGDTGGGNVNPLVASMEQAKLSGSPVPTADTVSVDANSVIDVSATQSGNGGKAIIWSDLHTVYAGTVLAKGGAQSGNGGFVEVSGKQTLTFSGVVDTSAAAGKHGMLLLDPLNAYIDDTPGTGVILASALEFLLQFTDVAVTTNNDTGSDAGDLFVNAPITWSTNSTLWLGAWRHVVVNADITNTYTGSVGSGGNGKHEINLLAGASGNGVGTVIFGPNAVIKTQGEVNLVFNPTVNPAGSGVNQTSYVGGTENFTAHLDLTGGGVLIQRYLVNTPADLQNVTNNLNANYVMLNDIDMSGFSGFVPIGNGSEFNGTFVSFNNAIVGLEITSALGNVGLFSKLSSTAEVNDISLIGFNVTATGSANVGTLAGWNAGKVRDVEVFVTTVTAAAGGSNIGGLLGRNSGIVERAEVSIAEINVPAVAGTFNAGGLVGINATGGSIQYSSVGGVLGSLFTTGVGAEITSNATLGFGDSISLGVAVGLNEGMIQRVSAFGKVTDYNAVANVGGLAGTNAYAGTIFESFAAVQLTGGATMGGAIGNNVNYAPGALSNVYYDSTLFTGSGVGTGTSTGVTGLSTATLTSGNLPPGFGPDWIAIPGLYPFLKPKIDDNPLVVMPSVPGQQVDDIDIDDQEFATVMAILSLLADNKADPAATGAALISLPESDPAAGPGGTNANTASTNGSTGTRTASQTPGAPPPAPPPPPLRPVTGPDGERFSSIPPLNENRFIQNEVVLQMGANVPIAEVERIAQSMGLTILSQQSLNALGRNAFRFSVSGGRSVRDVIRALEANSIVAVAQPNYQYKLSQSGNANHKGDPAQYMVEKLQLEQVHRLASGKNVTIAVIDSEADKQHTELQGQISELFNAVGEAEKAHSHGTAMVGAISSRDRLLGVAPGAKILAVRAFSESQQSAEGTTFHILKSIDWAVSQGARVINMSFAGPRDPALERTLKRAYDQGVVLVAAAGNAGPKSPPLYPGADPSVIAVTATDAVDRGFKMANQGAHVSVASPGVDVLAPAPQEAYQMSTGTSIATAHVSGVVALMLERDPTLTPADVRKILESTATDLGPKGKDTQFGWGLVNPQKALQLVDERKRKMTEARPVITTASR